jgi:HJR/Mrr/RecB family endonuclease
MDTTSQIKEEIRSKRKKINDKKESIEELRKSYNIDTCEKEVKFRYPVVISFFSSILIVAYLGDLYIGEWASIILLFLIPLGGSLTYSFFKGAPLRLKENKRRMKNKRRSIEEDIRKIKREIEIKNSELERARSAREDKRSNLDWWFSLTPREFEEEVAKLDESRGYQCTLTDPSNDGGYDISVDGEGNGSFLVECKRWDSPVGRPNLQKLMGAVGASDAEHGVFVTTSRFTDQAKKFAAKTNLDLIDGRKLLEL